MANSNNLFSMFEKFCLFLKEEKAQGDWSSVYMLIVLIIAALLLVTVVKPMFKQSQEIVKKTTPTTS